MSAWALVMIPGAPLTVALLLAVGGARLKRAAGSLAVAGMGAALLLLLVLLGATDPQAAVRWASTGGLALNVGLRLDALSRYMAFLVAGISLMVNVYACGYMAEEPGRRRFFALFSFFGGAMLALVMTNSLLLLFAAWEGVGLASFLLIGYRFKELRASHAARNAFIITRLADMGFLLGWLWALMLTGTTDISTFLGMIQRGEIASGAAAAIAVLCLLGAMGKSAQLPLSAWLPPAMAGPTPVSALIHSATMVAAGIYLILRLFPLYAQISWLLNGMLWVGAATAVFAAVTAMRQGDLKRVLAWSTVSQLGEMMMALGLSAPLAALFHLTTHGAFKSALFLSAGAVEHATGTRELDRLGGLKSKQPVVSLTFAAAGLSLAGAPFMSGFFSEERILSAAVGHHFLSAALVVLLVFLAAVYISRAWAAAFMPWPGAPEPDARAHGWAMTAGMLGLTLPAVAVGWLLSGNLTALVPFPEAQKLDLVWKVAAMLAWGSGSLLGFSQVRRRGPQLALGAMGQRLEPALNRWTILYPSHLVGYASRGLQHFESLLDAFVKGLRSQMLRIAARFNALEDALDRLAAGDKGLRSHMLRLSAHFNALEDTLDRLAAGGVGCVFKSAFRSDRIETRSISDGIDAGASRLARAGAFIGTLQSGKLYAYTMLLFMWVAGLGVVGWVVWLG